MRIISGKFKGRKLIESSNFKALRPTTDKNREALFNILLQEKFARENNFNIENSNVLDLCCGTGAVAFEALSRGAKFAYLLEKNSQHLEIAKKNAKILNAENEVKFFLGDAKFALKNLVSLGEVFHLIYVDPPYSESPLQFINNLLNCNLISPQTILIIESEKLDFEDLIVKNILKLIDRRKYGKSYFSFLSL